MAMREIINDHKQHTSQWIEMNSGRNKQLPTKYDIHRFDSEQRAEESINPKLTTISTNQKVKILKRN